MLPEIGYLDAAINFRHYRTPCSVSHIKVLSDLYCEYGILHISASQLIVSNQLSPFANLLH